MFRPLIYSYMTVEMNKPKERVNLQYSESEVVNRVAAVAHKTIAAIDAA